MYLVDYGAGTLSETTVVTNIVARYSSSVNIYPIEATKHSTPTNANQPETSCANRHLGHCVLFYTSDMPSARTKTHKTVCFPITPVESAR